MTVEDAGDFLAHLADRIAPGSDTAAIRTVVELACGGRLESTAPDGDRASNLTISGTPFEVSVAGGGGTFVPAVRYTAEAASQDMRFDSRLAAQLSAIGELVTRLPGSDDRTAELLRSFVETLYPTPADIPDRFRFATWTGIVHHIDIPSQLARLKVYGSPAIVKGGMQRLCGEWPQFADLASVPESEDLIRPAGAAIEIDARGEVNHKIYYGARNNDIAVPMKLVRHFGDPAWQVLNELVECGIDAARLHRYSFFACCTRGGFALHLGAKQGDDLTGTVRALAARHYGSTEPVDALTDAARSSGADWRYSAIGLGLSTDRGPGKLNVYGTPTWGTVAPIRRRRRQRISRPTPL
ncbi:hypothetical protein [Nocardia sp. NPDC003345]